MRKGELWYSLLFLVIGIFAGLFLSNKVSTTSSSSLSALREHSDKYKFIAPYLASSDKDTQSDNFKNLKNKVNNFISSNTGTGDTVSVYFRDLNKGEWFGIDQDKGYAPASLLKTVIMIAYFKKAEINPGILSEQLTYESNLKTLLEGIPFEDPSDLKTDVSYSVDSLISKMIIDSDNGATNLLFTHLDDSFLNKVYKDLSLPLPGDEGYYDISAQAYSLFFRILYNATYLSRSLSEKALGILSRASFQDGLVSGVPKGTVVAHKFGEYIHGEEGVVDSVELHDCGIIYLPNDPYFLCVMTHTKSLDKDKNIIKNISSIVYSYLTK